MSRNFGGFMRIKEYSTREAVAFLAASGFTFSRHGKGGHTIYSNGTSNISLPTHSKTINRMLFARIVKENRLRG